MNWEWCRIVHIYMIFNIVLAVAKSKIGPTLESLQIGFNPEPRFIAINYYFVYLSDV